MTHQYEIPQAKLAYTVDDLMKVMRVSKPTVYNQFKSGALKSKKVGGRRLVSHESLTEFLNSEDAG